MESSLSHTFDEQWRLFFEVATRPLRLAEEATRPDRQSRGVGGGGYAGRMQYVVAVGSSPKWKSHRCSKVSRRLHSWLSCIRTGDEVCGTMRSVLYPKDFRSCSHPPFIWAILVRLGISPHQCSLLSVLSPFLRPEHCSRAPGRGARVFVRGTTRLRTAAVHSSLRRK